MEIISFEYKNATYRGRKWVINNPKANVVIFEGMEECVYRYDKFASYLNNNGFSVYALDNMGHGDNIKNDFSNVGEWPKNGFMMQVDIFNDFICDLNKKTNIPTYIFAHSFGSFIGQTYIQKYSNHVSKYVLCGSGAKQPGTKIGQVLAWFICIFKAEKKAKLLDKLMFGSSNKRIKNPRTKYDWLSVNEENVDAYIKDPKCGFGSTNRFCYELVQALNTIYKKKLFNNINKKINILLISGSDDPITGYTSFTKQMVDRYKKANIEKVDSIIYQNMRHEILNEKDWEKVANDVINFYNM